MINAVFAMSLIFTTLESFVMGWYQRGVHFGAASLKRGEERSKFPVAIFCPPFFLHYL